MTMQTKMTPTWLIERVAQGELETSEVERIRERLVDEGRSLDDELAALRESNRQLLVQLPRDMMGASIRRRAATADAPPRTSRFRLSLAIAPTLLAGSLALAVVMVRSKSSSDVSQGHRSLPSPEEIGIKGDSPSLPRLVVYRQKPGQGPGLAASERLSDGARAARGDVLQLAYDKAPDGLYGVLLSLDGAGRVTQHLPDEGARSSAPLTSVREILMPSAYELDDAPRFERFVLITARQPFAVGAALAAAHALTSQGASAQTQPLSLDPSFGQTSLLVHKIGKGPQ
jgi:hypothetical protein